MRARLIRLMVVLSTVSCMFFAVTGCKTTGRYVRWYDGPPAETNKVALLKVQRDGNIILSVDKIDGQLLTKGEHIVNTASKIELLPGHHELLVSYRDSNGNRSTRDSIISFDAEMGKSYELRGAPRERGFWKDFWQTLTWQHWYWTLWIIDSESKNVVAGIPRETPLHWYE
jgi:hypothetical protein